MPYLFLHKRGRRIIQFVQNLPVNVVITRLQSGIETEQGDILV